MQQDILSQPHRLLHADLPTLPSFAGFF